MNECLVDDCYPFAVFVAVAVVEGKQKQTKRNEKKKTNSC